MREIKFRAWDNNNREMYSPHSKGKPWYEMTVRPFSELDRYTGLKDKNGVEIYEGDVVETNTEGWRGKVALVRYTVQWNLMHAGWRLFPTKKTVDAVFGTDMDKTETISGWGSRDLEVIGNIYENPELLEKQDG